MYPLVFLANKLWHGQEFFTLKNQTLSVKKNGRNHKLSINHLLIVERLSNYHFWKSLSFIFLSILLTDQTLVYSLVFLAKNFGTKLPPPGGGGNHKLSINPLLIVKRLSNYHFWKMLSFIFLSVLLTDQALVYSLVFLAKNFGTKLPPPPQKKDFSVLENPIFLVNKIINQKIGI